MLQEQYKNVGEEKSVSLLNSFLRGISGLSFQTKVGILSGVAVATMLFLSIESSFGFEEDTNRSDHDLSCRIKALETSVEKLNVALDKVVRIENVAEDTNTIIRTMAHHQGYEIPKATPTPTQ